MTPEERIAYLKGKFWVDDDVAFLLGYVDELKTKLEESDLRTMKYVQNKEKLAMYAMKLVEAIYLQMSSHDQGHSPCYCNQARMVVTQSKLNQGTCQKCHNDGAQNCLSANPSDWYCQSCLAYAQKAFQKALEP